MAQPIIGITTGHEKSVYGIPLVAMAEQYVHALVRADAIPVLIPLGLPKSSLQQLFPRLDGVLFTGGGDMEPAIFNGADHPSVSGVDAIRDATETTLVNYVIEQNIPFFGICRGHQVINVTLGGTLYTHIDESQHTNALRHDYYPNWPRGYIAHQVRVEEESRISQIVEQPILQVNSLHHQGIRDLAPGLKAVAFAPDGIIEAVELPGHPFGMSVQWHPEWLPEQMPMRALFHAFVEACQKN